MDQKQIKNNLSLRSLGLTVMLCALTVTVTADIAYGTHIIGHVLLMTLIGVLAVIFMTCEKTVSVLNAAVLVAIIFFTSNGSLMLSMFGCVLILGALLLAYAVQKKSAKTSAVLVVSTSVTIGYLIVMALFYVAQGNSLAISELFSVFNELVDSIKISFADIIRQSVDSLSEEMLAYYAQYDITQEVLLETSLKAMEEYVEWLQLLLPGCFLFFAQVMGYFSVITFEKTARLVRCESVLPESRWRLYPTHVSCVIYILVTTVYIVASVFSSTSAFAIIITNFWTALMPVMLVCGFRSL